MNRSRRERQRLPAKPEFGMAWIAASSFVGLFFGFVAELLWLQKAIVMVAGGFAGALVGSAIEGVRFYLGTWRFNRARKG